MFSHPMRRKKLPSLENTTTQWPCKVIRRQLRCLIYFWYSEWIWCMVFLNLALDWLKDLEIISIFSNKYHKQKNKLIKKTSKIRSAPLTKTIVQSSTNFVEKEQTWSTSTLVNPFTAIGPGKFPGLLTANQITLDFLFKGLYRKQILRSLIY